MVTIITKEVMYLWELSAIPFKEYLRCREIVQKCICNWVETVSSKRKSVSFQSKLDTLLDLRPSFASTLPDLKKHLCSSGNALYMKDYEFFKGQMSFPQTGSISSTKDVDEHRKGKHREQKKSNASLFAEKHKGIDTKAAPKSDDKTQVCKSNIIIKSLRECTVGSVPVVDAIDESETLREEEWKPPLRFARKLSKKTEKVRLELPSKGIPMLLAGTSTSTKTSIRHEFKLTTTIFEAGDGDISDASISPSTIWRQRKKAVVDRASNVRDEIKKLHGMKFRENEFFIVLHWDGKLIQLMTGDVEDRLAIAFSSPNKVQGQFLASPVIPDGTGQTMANFVHQTATEYNMIDDVHAFVFDTTASNTGCWKGSITIFEAMLGRAALWLACRHHIPELHIKHANEVVRGPSDGPDDVVFKAFKKQWKNIKVEERSLWKWPESGGWKHRRAMEVLSWADSHMKNATWPREDYRELLELVVIYLGGVVKRVQYSKLVLVDATTSIRKPGALHRARFMASC